MSTLQVIALTVVSVLSIIWLVVVGIELLLPKGKRENEGKQ
jgi:hypothetical protein